MTLYISDLDGTLLSPAGVVSKTSTAILNRLLKQGLHFTVATARTPLSALPLLGELPIRDPMILLNGAICYDPGNEGFSQAIPIAVRDLEMLAAAEAASGVEGMLFSMEKGRFTANLGRGKDSLWKGYFPMEKLAHVEAIDPRIHSRAARELLDGQVVYGLYMDDAPQRLEILQAQLQGSGLTVDCYQDIYTENRWCLEVCSREANKGAAAARLRQAGYDDLVAFGDSRNDLSLFETCDFNCAMENAVPELKQKAHVIIGSNAHDGVARYLDACFVKG